MESWEKTITLLKQEMESKHEARERALRSSRSIIQLSSRAIKHVHRGQLPDAANLIDEAKQLASEARASMVGHPEIEYAGYLQDAEKELVEACACLAIVAGDPLPTPHSLSVQANAYLHGMGECASELRRTVLDLMRQGNMTRAEELFEQMEEIYDSLTTFDFPDGLTGGLRRTCDALRAVIERTRSDMTMTRVQQDLLNELKRAGR